MEYSDLDLKSSHGDLNDKVPLRSSFLSTWSLVGAAVWVGLGGVAIAGESVSLGVGFKVSKRLHHFKMTFCASCLRFKM